MPRKGCYTLDTNDIVGKIFGRLTVLRFIGRDKNKRLLYECECSCTEHNRVFVDRYKLLSGHTRSCGCYHKERQIEAAKTHGMTNTSFYSKWCNIKTRCMNKNRPQYKDYGGRGITLDERWNSFENFKEDMYDEYLKACEKYGEKNVSIERKDVDKGYYKENCIWADYIIQANNKTDTHWVDIFDEKISLMNANKLYSPNGVSYRTVLKRIRDGMNDIDAIVTPLRSRGTPNNKKEELSKISDGILFFNPDKPPEEYLEAKRITG